MFSTSSRLFFFNVYILSLLCLNESVSEAINNMNRVRSFLVEVIFSYAVYKIDEMYNVQKQ